MSLTCGYHCTAKPVSFGKGQSAVHTAAYNARQQLYQDLEGRSTRNYSGHDGEVLFSGIFAPKDAPDWVHDRQELWNRAEAAERQKVNGQPARNMIVAFPHELDQQQREWMLKDFAREDFARRGMIVDVAMHAPDEHGDQRNHHAHILVTMRRLDGDAFAKTKCRDWNSKAQLEAWREGWAEKGAHALERAGYPVEAGRWRHGHKTLEAQRTAAIERGDVEFADALRDREATMHKGPKLSGMERKGQDGPDRLEALKGIIARNDIRVELAQLDKELRPLEAISGFAKATPDTHADHLKADQQAQREAGLKGLATAARADQRALNDPVAKAYGDGARDAAQEVRQEQREARAQAGQAAPGFAKATPDTWRADVESRKPAPMRGRDGSGLRVVDGATGAVSKLGDAILDILSGSAAAPRPGKAMTMEEYLADPAARAAHHRSAFVAARDARDGDKALERIGKDMEANRSLRMEDLRSLTRDHQEAIRLRGDDGVRSLIEEARKRRDDGRERE